MICNFLLLMEKGRYSLMGQIWYAMIYIICFGLCRDIDMNYGALQELLASDTAW
jgi:hypothetical protein